VDALSWKFDEERFTHHPSCRAHHQRSLNAVTIAVQVSNSQGLQKGF
jgi:predicted nucleic acid-binding Zn ribbon protein